MARERANPLEEREKPDGYLWLIPGSDRPGLLQPSGYGALGMDGNAICRQAIAAVIHHGRNKECVYAAVWPRRKTATRLRGRSHKDITRRETTEPYGRALSHWAISRGGSGRENR